MQNTGLLVYLGSILFQVIGDLKEQKIYLLNQNYLFEMKMILLLVSVMGK